MVVPFNEDEYRRLLTFQTALRRFASQSEHEARTAGLTAGQHQLLVAICGLTREQGPTVNEVARQLFLREHSAVGLIDRAEAAGLVRREPDASDRRAVRVILTALGKRHLRQLFKPYRAALEELQDKFRRL
jgi:DNA-binding MarR family transcriptional regulator